jgi:hypothetical protein
MAQAFIGVIVGSKTGNDPHYCHGRRWAASVSLQSVEMRKNQTMEYIFFKKQQVLE